MAYPRREIEIIPENIPLNIVYEDDDLIVVNKPAGMVVHPSYGHYTGIGCCFSSRFYSVTIKESSAAILSFSRVICRLT